ncbi:AHH domain-containing protein [Phycicoccus sp. CSK15P-2]|nr:AHH domain-containing protein [Phycicoccus sp. CSK15P-2]
MPTTDGAAYTSTYLYVENQPLTHTDPSGMCKACWYVPVPPVLAGQGPEMWSQAADVASQMWEEVTSDPIGSYWNVQAGFGREAADLGARTAWWSFIPVGGGRSLYDCYSDSADSLERWAGLNPDSYWHDTGGIGFTVASLFIGAGEVNAVLRAGQAATRAPRAANGLLALSAPSSRVLAANLEAAGISRPAGSAAHHIVAGSSAKAAQSRAVLQRFGIDINDSANGVFLPSRMTSPNPTGAAVHSRIHTNAYYAEVNSLMGQATTRSDVLDVLAYIRSQLLSGGFP